MTLNEPTGSIGEHDFKIKNDRSDRYTRLARSNKTVLISKRVSTKGKVRM